MGGGNGYYINTKAHYVIHYDVKNREFTRFTDSTYTTPGDTIEQSIIEFL
jgi:hypothetical protein